MSFTTRDYQGRINGIFGKEVLKVDGMSGPNTRSWIAKAMAQEGVRKKEDLFTDGVRGVVWHWTASHYPVTDYDKAHYNFVHDHQGNTHDGAHTIVSQVLYNGKGRGASHTLMMNTGWIGQSVSAMAGAEGWPKLDWGSAPLNWEMIDAMLEKTAELSKEYNFPISKWTTLSHAEVQETLGIKQRNKWDFMVLPGSDRPENAVGVCDVLRKRLKEKFL